MKQHFKRKHPEAEIPEMLDSINENFNYPSVLPELPFSIYSTRPIDSNNIKFPHSKRYEIPVLPENKPAITPFLE